MAGALNRVQLIGHLGADPETRQTQAGKPVCSLRLATTDSWTDKSSGEKRDRTEWHRVVIFNEGLAGVAEKYLKKGAKAFIEGALRTRKYTDRDGVERYQTEIVLEAYGGQLILLDRAERAAAPDQDSYGTARTREHASAGGGGSASGRTLSEDLNDDIPF